MKIAFIITAYKLPDQLIRLVYRLSTDETAFYIHVDKNTGEGSYKHIVDQLRPLNNVHFLRRIPCGWGNFDVVRVILIGIQEVLASNINYDYAILLTGQCYPIKSNQYIQEFLQKNKGMSYLNYFSSPNPLALTWEERIFYWHIYFCRWHFVFPRVDMFSNRFLNSLWNPIARRIKIRRKIPGNIQPIFGGSQWCLTYECIKYVNDFVCRNKAFVHFFSRFVQFPTEIFIQTILLNSPLSQQIINDDLKYIDFTGHKAHPKILEIDDFDKFMSSGDLFARKFDSNKDNRVLNMIDNVIGE